MAKKLVFILIAGLLSVPSLVSADDKEPLVLMPLRVTGIDRSMLGAMEAALVQGLRMKYKVFAGAQVRQKVQEVFTRESETAAGEEGCDETKCMQDIGIAFQAELIATANIAKRSGGYFLALSIRNIGDDTVVDSKTMPCKACDEFQVVEKLKTLACNGCDGFQVVSKLKTLDNGAKKEPAPYPKPQVIRGVDKELTLWKEVSSSDDAEMFQLYLNKYPDGVFAELAKLKARDLSGGKKRVSPVSNTKNILKHAEQKKKWLPVMDAPAPDIKMVIVKGGCFEMGDTFGDGRRNEKPVHEVCVDDFQIGKYEVTQQEWAMVLRSTTSNRIKGFDDYPMDNVSWNDIQEFIEKLNAKTGQSYRLPTEAEWEYAARSGGKNEKYSTKSGSINRREANYGAENSSSSGDKSDGFLNSAPVGSYPPNELGLYDMSGNVSEWVSDGYSSYYKISTKNNPVGNLRAKYRVVRGGSWIYPPSDLRATDRDSNVPYQRNRWYGFRLAAPSP